MAQQIGKLQSLVGGISTVSKKNGPAGSFAWGRSIDFRSESSQQTTYPKSVKISGSIVTDLPMFADIAHDANAVIASQTNTLFFHGNTGSIYAIDTNDAVTKEYTVPNSSGNGLVYFAETNQLYIPTNTSITRRDMTTGNYYDYFLETSGGAPTNTKALLLVAASSQSATRADTASLSITGDMTLEAYLKPTSLPTGTNKMAIISKWDESGAKRSYKLDIITTSAAFGDASDGALTVSVSATETVIDANCTGTAGTNTLTISNTTGSFAVGQKVYIHQSRGSGVGQKQINEIIGIVGSVLTLADNLTFSPSHSATTTVAEKAQVRVMKKYGNVTINNGVIWTAKAWDGLKGGLGFVNFSNGTFTNNGTITAAGKGYRGGAGGNAGSSDNDVKSLQGEGTLGVGGYSNSSNGNGGGGSDGSGLDGGNGGGGGGDITAGGNGGAGQGSAGIGGIAVGVADASTPIFGGAGGGGRGEKNGVGVGGGGGDAGAIIDINAAIFINNGTISNDGGNGNNATFTSTDGAGGGGGGAAGPNHFTCQTFTNNGTITANKGANGTPGTGAAGAGGTASDGINALSYYTSYSGTTTPTLNATQDDNLGIANGYALRLYISSDGTAFETYTQNIDDFIGVYKFYSVSWKASTSTAIFYENAQAIGTKTGALTAINDNTSIFGIGCYVDSGSTKTGFYNGLIDDTRIWAGVRTPAQIANYYNQVMTGLEVNQVAYFAYEGNLNDSQTSGLNNLTANNAPTYSSDVAFKGVTTRGDEDVSSVQSGQTYTLLTALSETAHNKLTFVPTKEPFKSLALNVNTVGTGNWTVTVHDDLNNVVTTMTVANADMQTGVYEFKFAASKRIVLNASYHIHVFDTTGDGKVVTQTASFLDTAYLKTYFQILVNDTYHMAVQFKNLACIANERYLAVLQSGNVYNPVRIIFPSGYRIRSLAFWQQYLAIGLWFGNNITDTDKGKIFFWDGEADTYIDEVDVPQGGINAMLGTQGGLLTSAGYKGGILEYTGYPSSYRYTARTSAQLVFRMPNIADGDTVEIAPGALTMWNSMNRIGASLNTNSSTFHQGIYTYGQYTDQDPMSVGFDYPLSIGDNMNSNVKIGCLFTRNAKLYAGFQNSNTFGIDVVDENAAPATTGALELLITDLGSVAAKKLPLVFRTDFLPLTSGQSVTLKIKPDRNNDWITLGTQSTVGATDIRTTINQRIKEVQFGLDWTNTTTPVTFTQYSMESEDESDSRPV